MTVNPQFTSAATLAGILSPVMLVQATTLVPRSTGRPFREFPVELSPRAQKLITRTLGRSASPEGKAAKLEGLAGLYRRQPNLTDDLLEETCKFLMSSNSAEGYREKLSALNEMLKIQPHLSPAFVAQLRVLVDHSPGLDARTMVLDQVTSMLGKNPALSPETLREVRVFVNEGKSTADRRLKLGSLNAMMVRYPTLESDRIKTIGEAVNRDSELSSRRALLRGYEQAFKHQPTIPAQSLKAMADLVYRESSQQGQEERAATAVRVLRLHPEAGPEVLQGLTAAATNALTPHDGTLRARVVANDHLIAHQLGLSTDQMFALAPVAATAGGCAAAGLLHPDSALSMAQDSLQVCRQRADFYTEACSLSRDKLLRRYQAREIELRQKHIARLVVLPFLTVGAGAALAAGAFGLALGPTIGVTIGAALMTLPIGKVRLDRASENALRTELAKERDTWASELGKRQRIDPALQALLAAQSGARANLREHEEAVVVGAVRVRRKGYEEE